MKHKSQYFAGLTSALAAAGLLCAVSPGQGQTNNPNTFDTSASTAGWTTWWGPPNPTIAWDSTLDASNNAASGSMQYVEAFTGANGEQFMTFGTFADRWTWDNSIILDGTKCTNLDFDIRIDPSTAPTINNDYGYFEFGLVDSSWNWNTVKGVTIPLTATNWTHYSLPIPQTIANLNVTAGTFIKLWSNGSFTNTLTFNVDNIYMEPRPGPPPPPPTLSLGGTPTSGLNLITTPVGGTPQYDRQMVYTKPDSSGNYFSWINASGTVTYSVTLKQFPTDPPYGGFQLQLFLVPTNVMPYGPGDSSVDWNATNMVWLDIKRGGADFRYKVNEGSGNTMLFNSLPGGDYGTNGFPAGHLGFLPTTNAVGTWTLAFNNNTNVIVTNPEGVSTNYTLPAADALMFTDPLVAYVGAQANNAANIGQLAVVSHVKITGAAATADDSFSGTALDTTVWGVAAADASGVLVVPPNPRFWLSWTLPDIYFVPQVSAGVAGPWNDLSETNLLLMNGKRTVIVSASDVPAGNQAYFRLANRAASQLQVLLPGETNAPGTVTGKTGTPLPQTLFTPFDITVNACDSSWHIAKSCNDTVSFTSTDSSAILPSNAPLVRGTLTIQGQTYFDTSGTWTITATDVATGTTIAPATSTAITIP